MRNTTRHPHIIRNKRCTKRYDRPQWSKLFSPAPPPPPSFIIDPHKNRARRRVATASRDMRSQCAACDSPFSAPYRDYIQMPEVTTMRSVWTGLGWADAVLVQGTKHVLHRFFPPPFALLMLLLSSSVSCFSVCCCYCCSASLFFIVLVLFPRSPAAPHRIPCTNDDYLPCSYSQLSPTGCTTTYTHQTHSYSLARSRVTAQQTNKQRREENEKLIAHTIESIHQRRRRASAHPSR